MINFNYNGIKNTLASFNLLNISFNVINDISEKEIQNVDKISEPERLEKPELYQDHKTTLGGLNIDMIERINDDLVVYFFIQKDREWSEWHLVAPILLEQTTGRITQYGLGYFAFEGCGGGLNNTSSIMHYLKQHKKKGYKVRIVPKVVDTKLLNSFEYVDSGTTLNSMLEKSTDLILYRKDKFEWIHKQYQELADKYELN